MSEVSVAGKNVFVTGGSSGIGRACAVAFAAQDANVTIAALPGDDLAEMEARDVAGSRFRCLGGDLTDDRFLEEISGEVRNADILLNSAGMAIAAPFLDNDPGDWDRMFAINVRATMRVTLTAAKGMVDRGRGHIITISSALAHAVSPNTLCYAATKHALAAMHQGIRLELLGKGVRSTEIRPGLVWHTKLGSQSTHPAVLDHSTGRAYEGMDPDDVARAVLFAATAPDPIELDVIEIKPLGQL